MTGIHSTTYILHSELSGTSVSLIAETGMGCVLGQLICFGGGGTFSLARNGQTRPLSVDFLGWPITTIRRRRHKSSGAIRKWNTTSIAIRQGAGNSYTVSNIKWHGSQYIVEPERCYNLGLPLANPVHFLS